jgi:hypothetical protein
VRSFLNRTAELMYRPLSLYFVSLLFWDVTQPWLIVTDVSGQSMRLIVPKRQWLTTSQRCVPSQKKDALIYTAAEAWSHAHSAFISGPVNSVKPGRDRQLLTPWKLKKRKNKKRYRNKESKKGSKNVKTKKAGNKETGARAVTYYIHRMESKNLEVVNVPGHCPLVHLGNIGWINVRRWEVNEVNFYKMYCYE